MLFKGRKFLIKLYEFASIKVLEVYNLLANCNLDPNSYNFIKNFLPLNNNDDYLFYRIYCFRRHFQELENIVLTNDRPVKLFKRLMQCADCVYPILDKDLYKEIGNFVNENLGDEKIRLLNEATNIIKNINVINNHPYMHNNLSKSKELLQAQEALIATIKEMEAIDLDKDF